MSRHDKQPSRWAVARALADRAHRELAEEEARRREAEERRARQAAAEEYERRAAAEYAAHQLDC